jgi:hypothetical protein
MDPILTKINSGWEKSIGGQNYKKAAKWLRLFVQYTKTSGGVPEEFQPQAHEWIAFLIEKLDNIDDKSAPDVIQAIKFSRRQLKTRIEFGSGFSQTLTDAERERAAVIGRPVRLGFEDPKRALTPVDHSGDAILDNYLGPDESELD